MDDFNRPLYGDVFGVLQGAEIAVSLPQSVIFTAARLTLQGQDQIDRSLWGEIAPMEYDDDEEEEEDEEEEMEAEEEDDRRRPPADGLETPSGMATPSGLNSVTSTVPGGLETPEFVDLRKKKRQESEAPAGPGPSQPRDLYQVIPERESTSRGFMGSSTTYDISGLGQGGPGVLGADDLSKKVSNSITPFIYSTLRE